jgi:uncharacterized protein (DUF433 family)
MSEMRRITVNPNQRGLRVRVKDVREEILAAYPLLEAGDITASLEYAASQTDHPVLRVA